MSKKLGLILSVLTVLIVFSYIYLAFGDFFFQEGITGFQIMGSRLVIISRNESICDMTLESGWNLVSFPCIFHDTDVDLFLTGLNNSYQSIRYYTPVDVSDPWKSYNPHLPNWTIQEIKEVSRKEGYWIYVDEITEVYINNSLASPTLTYLSPGWNLIGYPSKVEKGINETFDTLIPNFDYVYLYNASDPLDKWREYTWNSSLPSEQDLNYTVYYYGYWIYMINPDTFVIS